MKFQRWEIDLIVDYIDDYVQASITRRTHPSIETSVEYDKARWALTEHLAEQFGENDES